MTTTHAFVSSMGNPEEDHAAADEWCAVCGKHEGEHAGEREDS